MLKLLRSGPERPWCGLKEAQTNGTPLDLKKLLLGRDLQGMEAGLELLFWVSQDAKRVLGTLQS
jgi:hypothetical protein